MQRTVSELSCQDWLALFCRQWQQGQHVAIIGPTGTGKTTLARRLLTVRDWVCVVAIKRHDDTLQDFRRAGGPGEPAYRVIKSWPPDYSLRRVVFWSKPETLDDLANQREHVLHAMQLLYLSGGWCVYFDDLSYVCDQLRIKTQFVTLVNQGRSSGLSVVSACTRPRKVPTEAFNQCRHYIVFHFDDEEETARIAQIVGVSRRSLLALMEHLGKHDFLAFAPGRLTIVRNRTRRGDG